MTTRSPLPFAILLAVAPALAMAAGHETMDANADGMISLNEAQAVWPDLSEEAFVTADLDAEGLLSPEEMASAQEMGTLPVTSDDG